MTKIEIVSHVWNYSRMWTYQMSSLLLHPPKNCEVQMTVMCCGEKDSRTMETIHAFVQWPRQEMLPGFLRNLVQGPERDIEPESYIGWPENISMLAWDLDKPNLMRRAIGRNWAALSTDADLVWFADCDMIFGEGALDALATYYEENKEEDATALMCPREALWCEQAHGDEISLAAKDWNGEPIDLDTSKFFRKRYNRAIGGVQIAQGRVCRDHGYIPGIKRYQNTATKWMRTREDPHFRRQLDRVYHSGKGRKVGMPNVARIRHTDRGRITEGLKL